MACSAQFHATHYAVKLMGEHLQQNPDGTLHFTMLLVLMSSNKNV